MLICGTAPDLIIMIFNYLKIVLLLNAACILSISCQKKSITKQLNTQTTIKLMTDYKEQFRPQFHFSPQEKWMNDPNGLVYYKGVYHLFYQYYPEDIVWGPMHWGHAVSKDLISWEHKPIALFPDELGHIFSGSAVVDIHNTSGLGTKENPPLVAIFTYHLMEGEKAGRTDFQTQGVAYSLDNGDTWTKYQGNPVIGNDDIKDFRDPKVFWHDETNRWIMALVAGDYAMFYSSSDLKEWVYLSDFGQDRGAHGGVWECPDLFKLKVGETDEEKWVLLISINPGAPNGGSGTQYFIGDFDGTTFTAEHTDEKWIDYGADNYAGVTFNNTPNDERILIGWMSNWYYAQNTPTENWRSAMTLPRELSLIKENDNYFLRNTIIEAFENYKTIIEQNDRISLDKKFVLSDYDFSQSEIKFQVNLRQDLRITLKNDKEALFFEMNPSGKEMTLDRHQSGLVDFEPRFAEAVHNMPYDAVEKEVDIQILMDKSSIEIFIDRGRYVMTEQIFPTKNYTVLQISSKSEDVSIKNMKVSKIKAIW